MMPCPHRIGLFAARSWSATARLLLAAAAALAVTAAEGQSLVLAQRIELPAVNGRLDHLAIDVDAERLFVAAVGADSVEVVDLATGRWTRRIEGTRDAQGIVYVHKWNRLFVTSGQAGRLDAFADGTRPSVATTPALGDADNLRFDSGEQRLYVGYGEALATIDPVSMSVLHNVALGGHPEAFEFERSGRRIFVNVPSARHIAVIDRDAGNVTAVWKLAGTSQNFAMALDEPGQRLFVATRQPANLLVYDTRTGLEVASMPLCRDADDLFFDARRRQIYAVCGEGVVLAIRQHDPDHYELAERTTTTPGARTGLFVPGLSTLYVAAPAGRNLPAEIRVYSIK
jgi:DNA-binding beta-propeller fold protein YncE